MDDETFSIRLDFDFGAQFDKDGNGILRDELQSALKLIKKEAAQIFGAFRLVPTSGGRTDSKGKFVSEDGYTLYTIQTLVPPGEEWDKFEAKIKEFADVIKTQLNQETVAVFKTLVQFEQI